MTSSTDEHHDTTRGNSKRTRSTINRYFMATETEEISTEYGQRIAIITQTIRMLLVYLLRNLMIMTILQCY